MLSVLPFEIEHARDMRREVELTDTVVALAANEGRAWTGFDADQRPIVSAGIMKADHHRALCWSLFADPFKKSDMLQIHRHILGFLDSLQPDPYMRLEMTVVTDFKPGHRWARMLGFKAEGVMRLYDEYGNDHTLYARIRTQ